MTFSMVGEVTIALAAPKPYSPAPDRTLRFVKRRWSRSLGLSEFARAEDQCMDLQGLPRRLPLVRASRATCLEADLLEVG
jgi:hypothetical protein